MIKKIFKEIESMDDRVVRLVNYGFLVSFAIAIAGAIMLLSYSTYKLKYDFYKGGILLIKASTTFAAECFASRIYI